MGLSIDDLRKYQEQAIDKANQREDRENQRKRAADSEIMKSLNTIKDNVVNYMESAEFEDDFKDLMYAQIDSYPKGNSYQIGFQFYFYITQYEHSSGSDYTICFIIRTNGTDFKVFFNRIAADINDYYTRIQDIFRNTDMYQGFLSDLFGEYFESLPSRFPIKISTLKTSKIDTDEHNAKVVRLSSWFSVNFNLRNQD